MAYIGGEVFSQAEGYTSLSALWPAFAFHAVAMALGTGMLGKGIGSRQVTQASVAGGRA